MLMENNNSKSSTGMLFISLFLDSKAGKLYNG
jgi:hypothetical protein